MYVFSSKPPIPWQLSPIYSFYTLVNLHPHESPRQLAFTIDITWDNYFEAFLCKDLFWLPLCAWEFVSEV